MLLSLLCVICVLCLSLNGRVRFSSGCYFILSTRANIGARIGFLGGWNGLNVFAVECGFHTSIRCDASTMRLRRMRRERERKRERYPIMFDGK